MNQQKAAEEEVDKLLQAIFTREIMYPNSWPAW